MSFCFGIRKICLLRNVSKYKWADISELSVWLVKEFCSAYALRCIANFTGQDTPFTECEK